MNNGYQIQWSCYKWCLSCHSWFHLTGNLWHPTYLSMLHGEEDMTVWLLKHPFFIIVNLNLWETPSSIHPTRFNSVLASKLFFYCSVPDLSFVLVCCSENKQEGAGLEAARRGISGTRGHEPTSNQWAKAVGMKRRSLDNMLCNGRESREKINRSYRKLVVSIATSYQGRGLSLQDLIQVPTCTSLSSSFPNYSTSWQRFFVAGRQHWAFTWGWEIWSWERV